MASTRIPSARVSHILQAHLSMVFTVAGATIIAAGGGRTSGDPWLFVGTAHRMPGLSPPGPLGSMNLHCRRRR